MLIHFSVTSGKYAVAMKHVNQRDGEDLDPTNIKLGDGADKRCWLKFVERSTLAHQYLYYRRLTETEKRSLAIGAVLNAQCTKCGQKGKRS